MDKVLLTTQEAAAALGIGRTKLYEVLGKPGGIPICRIGRTVRIHVDDIRRFAGEQRRMEDGSRPTAA